MTQGMRMAQLIKMRLSGVKGMTAEVDKIGGGRGSTVRRILARKDSLEVTSKKV